MKEGRNILDEGNHGLVKKWRGLPLGDDNKKISFQRYEDLKI